jgi:hypothetical protein
MKPALCFVCGKAATQESPSRGAWVQFADYVPAPADSLDHPDGLEYVCREHLARAQSLTDLSAAAAVIVLRTEFGVASPRLPEPPKSWWRKIFG